MDHPADQSRRRSVPATAVAGLVALPVAAWWIVGDQSYKSSAQEGHVELDYTFRPFTLSGGLELRVGIAAAAIVVSAMIVLVAHARSTQWDHRWLGPLIAAALAGISCGYGWRVATAGVIGANIGAGLVILFGGPLVLALLGWTTARAIAVSRAPTPTIDVE